MCDKCAMAAKLVTDEEREQLFDQVTELYKEMRTLAKAKYPKTRAHFVLACSQGFMEFAEKYMSEETYEEAMDASAIMAQSELRSKYHDHINTDPIEVN